ncbi:malate dehydrogenase [Ignicoccus islandicus DSM 13165]|uniref:Malate dehydrogenase n=1 Tax=Ignicoccus islandicus DSM 13165 TaxID=940295 RepID=A0A0U3FQH7_9CREN|nr:hypothetical protein [Ignicoccus islandicus]6QSS_A Chain A, Malate dehydrogenase [Ignicoccus islandicus DSM 13165]6QSS_B Chain B, Malate dehydrogenase [Ignicoccus islandicus DSM 13165]6QSS_C Chain C, Malate dehydrogenase [Ignicoccus islandicus DSM 13165]6QSS_D Chain D, Malate dehydrogenase [Ignicoccus islandicus DSM 13165]ALU11712.1 malate dehydrogenase [Ignicoccus islandicus DSM 13165]
MARIPYKVAVIGTGRVGATFAYTMAVVPGIARMTLVDVVPGLAKGVMEDIKHAAAVFRRSITVEAFEDVSKVENADAIVITAGKPRKADMSRRDLANVNAQIIRDIGDKLRDRNPGALYVVVTNPVDVMTMVLDDVIGSKGTVIGTGTSLDTFRFRAAVSELLNVPIVAVDGYVVGEHGEEAFVAWSTVTIKGIHIDQYIKERNINISREQIEKYVKDVAASIIASQGATIWGPAATFQEIVVSHLANESKIIPISLPQNIEGVGRVAVSVPTIISGRLKPLVQLLNEEEQERLKRAAKAIRNVYESILT